MGYYDNVNIDLLNRIPLGVKKILEIGCGTGKLALSYKRRNPQCQWVGVELSSQAASLAREHCTRVYTADIEDPGFSWGDVGGGYDVVVLGDVIEHLKNPWMLLKQLVGCLSTNGSVVSCIPNIGHVQIVTQLLKGDFEYTSSGLLDATHLRFFTLKTMRDLYVQAGLEVYKFLPRRSGISDESKRVLELLKPVLEYANKGESDISRLEALQYVLAGSNRKDLPRVHVAFWSWAPAFSEARGAVPLAALGTLVNVTYSYHSKNFKIPQVPQGVKKIVVVQRALPASHEEWMQIVERLHKLGWAVVVEWDDHPSLFVPEVLANFEKAPWATVLNCDGVQTSTNRLREVLIGVRQGKSEDSVAVFENNVSEIPITPPRKPEAPKIFVGALNRQAEACLIQGAIDKALSSFPTAQVVVIHDRKLFDAIRSPNKVFFEVLPYAEYLTRMSECNILLAPLSDNLGNACKSDLKFVEASSFGLATIASPTVYGESILDGKTGLIANTADEFTNKLMRLLSDEKYRASLGQSAKEYVVNFRLQTYLVVKKLNFYINVYDALFAHRK